LKGKPAFIPLHFISNRFSLNTKRELYDAVKASLTTEESKMNDMDRRVIEMFLADFAMSGVHLPSDQVRKSFKKLLQTETVAASAICRFEWRHFRSGLGILAKRQ
jgi:Zn-dependent oligopeptidase